MHIVATVILVSVMLVLSGCTKKVVQPAGSRSEKLTYKKKNFDALDIERQEAALLDIAIPTYQQRLPIFCEDQYTGQVVLGYQSDATPEDHSRFFHEQMERYGWNLKREFKGSELFLEFEKPTRSCAYSLRPRIGFFGKKNGTDIVIYVEDSSIVY